ncbi:MAG: hypothetical protein ACLPLR_09290 [Terriglobales bacterium]
MHHALGFFLLVLEVVLVYFVVGKIFLKAGYPRWESLLLLIPLFNLLAIVSLAYDEWPIERELRQLKHPGEQPSEPLPLSIHGLPQGPL